MPSTTAWLDPPSLTPVGRNIHISQRTCQHGQLTAPYVTLEFSTVVAGISRPPPQRFSPHIHGSPLHIQPAAPHISSFYLCRQCPTGRFLLSLLENPLIFIPAATAYFSIQRNSDPGFPLSSPNFFFWSSYQIAHLSVHTKLCGRWNK